MRAKTFITEYSVPWTELRASSMRRSHLWSEGTKQSNEIQITAGTQITAWTQITVGTHITADKQITAGTQIIAGTQITADKQESTALPAD